MNGEQKDAAEIPEKKELFHIPRSSDEKPYLFGSRCKFCGYTCFPSKKVCVKCRRDGTMNHLRLGPNGILQNFAVMQVGPPDFPPPYIMGYIQLEEGPVVFSTITGCEAKDDALELGQPMELVIRNIKEDRDGKKVLGWQFRPIRRKDR